MKTRVLYTSNTLLRHIDPKEYKNAVGQLVPRLGSSLNTDLKWAVDFIEELDRYKCWEWYDESRTMFYDRHASLAADRIDEIKAEVQHLIQLGRPVPSDVRELGKRGRPKKGEEKGANSTFTRGSTHAAYLLARLDRDRPDLAKQVRAGELTANAAAIEAGFRKKLSGLDQIRRLWAKLNSEERAALLREFADQSWHVTGRPLAYIASANLMRRNLTKGQQAMALAMMYPEAYSAKKGKETLPFSKMRLAQARSVLRYSRSLAESVLKGTTRLDDALATIKQEQQFQQSDEAKLTAL